MSELERRRPGTNWTKAQLDELQEFCRDREIKEIADKFYKGKRSIARQAMWNKNIQYKKNFTRKPNKKQRIIKAREIIPTEIDIILSKKWLDVV